MSLRDDLLERRASITVWGTGFIGSSTLAYFGDRGLQCYGIDINEKVVTQVNNGEYPVPNLEYWVGFDIKPLVEQGLIECFSDYHAIRGKNVKVHFIAVPTEHKREPWLEPLWDVVDKIINIVLSESYDGQSFIIVESTLIPGTAKKIMKKIRGAGLEPEKLGLIISPRRDWFISQSKNLVRLDRIYGGETPQIADMAEMILSLVCQSLHRAPDCYHSEIVKSIENAYRHMDIALAMQLTLAFPDLDIREIMKLVGTKWNQEGFVPSCGIGGYCLPLAPRYLLKGAEKSDALTLLKHAIITDTCMPLMVVEALEKYNNIGILGLGYKANVKVPQCSPTIDISENLIDLGMGKKIMVHDPLFTDIEMRKYLPRADIKNNLEFLKECDAVVLIADHSQFTRISQSQLDDLLVRCQLIIDNTGAWSDWEFNCKYVCPGNTGWLDG